MEADCVVLCTGGASYPRIGLVSPLLELPQEPGIQRRLVQGWLEVDMGGVAFPGNIHMGGGA